MDRLLISHSEVDTLCQCEYKHKYAHTDKLESINHSSNLVLGTTGHKFLEVFLQGKIDRLNDEDAIDKATGATMHLDMAVKAIGIALPWATDIWPTLGWKPVMVEKEYRVIISDTLVYPFKMDAVIEIDEELVAVDHKFLWDPYPQQVIDLMPQLPKYIGGLRSHGIPVKYGIYNMLRTRPTDKDKYTQIKTYPNNNRVVQSMREQIEGMQRIQKGIEFPMRTANKINCSNCQFSDLCKAELDGDDTTLMREHFFQPNTYGYKDI